MAKSTKSSPTEAPKRRAFLSNLVFELESWTQLRVDLLSARPTQDLDFVLLCPEHGEPVKPSQRYICPENENHGPYEQNQLLHGREIEKTLFFVSDEDYKASKEPEIVDQPIKVHVVPSEQLWASTRPTGSSYLMRPQMGSETLYAALERTLSLDPSRSLVCKISIKKCLEKLFQLQSWNGQLVLQELCHPNELAPALSVSAEVTDAQVEMVGKLLKTKEEKFDAHEFRHLGFERIAAIDEKLLANPPVKKKSSKTSKKSASTDSVMADLEASIKKAEKKKTKVRSAVKKAS